jgi:hypothetical protein
VNGGAAQHHEHGGHQQDGGEMEQCEHADNILCEFPTSAAPAGCRQDNISRG